jgi:phospholipase/carboxylesterase
LKSLTYDRIDTGPKQTRAFIMIHGWKGNKNSFKSVSKLMNLDNTAWFFPEAPYDFEGNSETKTWAIEKSPGVWEVDEPRNMLKQFLLNDVFVEFDPKNVFVMGFSQGAAVCYELILSFEKELGGIFPVAGFIRDYFNKNDLSRELTPKQINTLIYIGHGKDDDVVPLESSIKSYELLKDKCNNVRLDIYNGKHKINLSYLNKIKDIIISL